jgi:hypothetical protein
VSIGSRDADERLVTTLATTDALITEDEATAAEAAHIDGLEAVARLHEQAMARIAQLAEGWNAPADEPRVLRMTERPTVTQHVEAAAA